MKVISVRFRPSGRSYYFDPGALSVCEGDHVIVETARGVECGEVTCGNHEVATSAVPDGVLKPVQRMADGVDVRKMQANRRDEANACRVCEQRVAAHGLKMKLVEAEYNLDRSKLVFYFTADGRVDFRELVRDLAGQFHTRIELRQIGVRDESKMLGGLGQCGMPFCCTRFLKGFQPVSIKMAKEQGLSLNPAKISGACGRLMCCLAYEQKSYEYLNAITPQQGSIVRTPDGEGVVLEANPVSGTLKVRGNVESLAPKVYKREECVYLRGGRRAPRAPDPEDGPCPACCAQQAAKGEDAAAAPKSGVPAGESGAPAVSGAAPSAQADASDRSAGLDAVSQGKPAD
jgi:cell fate regulator YaaT (PSP1 superfamily)